MNIRQQIMPYNEIRVEPCLSPGLHLLPLRAAFAPTGAFTVRRFLIFASEMPLLEWMRDFEKLGISADNPMKHINVKRPPAILTAEGLGLEVWNSMY